MATFLVSRIPRTLYQQEETGFWEKLRHRQNCISSKYSINTCTHPSLTQLIPHTRKHIGHRLDAKNACQETCNTCDTKKMGSNQHQCQDFNKAPALKGIGSYEMRSATILASSCHGNKKGQNQELLLLSSYIFWAFESSSLSSRDSCDAC